MAAVIYVRCSDQEKSAFVVANAKQMQTAIKKACSALAKLESMIDSRPVIHYYAALVRDSSNLRSEDAA